MLKIKIFFVYLLRVLERQSKLFIFLGLGILFILIILIKFQNDIFRPSLTEGVIGTFTEGNMPDTVSSLLTSSLVEIDNTGKPMPSLAQSWQANTSNTIYTIKLKPNLYWSDGTKLKAQEIALSLPDVEITALDDQTIQFKLSDSFSPFPNLLKKPVFKKNSLVGTGPYKVSQLKKDKIFVTKLVLNSSNKSLPQLNIRFYPNEKIAKNALRLGEVQALLGINDVDDLTGEKTLAVLNKPNFTQLVTIFYNTKDPVLSDDNFRLALSFAAPSIKGETEAQTSIPSNSWAFNSEVKDFLDNPTQEQNYIKKVKQGADSTITLTATSFLKNVGERVVESWNKQGIKAVLRTESGIPQNFQALLITQNIPTDPDQYSLWHSTQTQTNISHFSNPRVDKDLEDGRKTADTEIRKQKYLDFQKTLLDHAPATFLYFPKYNVVYMKKIEPQIKKVLDLQLKGI